MDGPGSQDKALFVFVFAIINGIVGVPFLVGVIASGAMVVTLKG